MTEPHRSLRSYNHSGSSTYLLHLVRAPAGDFVALDVTWVAAMLLGFGCFKLLTLLIAEATSETLSQAQ